MAIIYWVLPKSQALCCKHLYSVLHFTFTRVRSGSHYLSPSPLNRREFPKGKLCPWRVEWLAWGQSSSMRTRGIRAECLYLWSLHSHASGASLLKDINNYLLNTYFFYQSSNYNTNNAARSQKAKMLNQRGWAR